MVLAAGCESAAPAALVVKVERMVTAQEDIAATLERIEQNQRLMMERNQ